MSEGTAHDTADHGPTTHDPATQIKSVSRRLELTSRDGGGECLLVASQTYDSDIDDVWDAVTNAERIPRWFLPISGDLRQGGRYELQGNASGTISRCVPPRELALTWESGGDVSWVEVRLTEGAGGTTLELRHKLEPDEKWEEFGPSAVGIGWDGALFGLSQHLSGAPKLRPEDAMAWMASDEGKEFMTSSGLDWRAADIAAGTDEATAVARSGRGIAAYTGQTPDGSGG
jgi:uncharacterized protein YndB with AHSA1/START domain